MMYSISVPCQTQRYKARGQWCKGMGFTNECTAREKLSRVSHVIGLCGCLGHPTKINSHIKKKKMSEEEKCIRWQIIGTRICFCMATGKLLATLRPVCILCSVARSWPHSALFFHIHLCFTFSSLLAVYGYIVKEFRSFDTGENLQHFVEKVLE